MPLFNAGQSLGLYRLGRQEAELRAEKARKLKEAAERKSAIQAVIDARMSGGLGSKVAPKQDAPAETHPCPVLLLVMVAGRMAWMEVRLLRHSIS
jgi:hypothetical protein